MRCFVPSNLFNEVALESDVFGGFVRKCHGDDAGQPLCLVDDSVSEGQVLPVLDLNLTISNHPAHFLLDPIWEIRSFSFNEDEFFCWKAHCCLDCGDLKLLTLYFWILGHKQKSPSQCSCSCISAGNKEMRNCGRKVFIAEVTVGPRFLQVKGNKCSCSNKL